MNRFFRTSPQTYEFIRSAMDAASGYPSTYADTWFAPIAAAAKDASGNPVIAAIPQIAERFEAEGAEEITPEEYQNLMPQPEEN